MRYLSVLFFAFISSYATADEPKTPLEKYRGTTGYYAMICDLKIETTSLKVDLREDTSNDMKDIFSCLKDAREKTKPLLSAAVAELKSDSQSALLKQYHLTFLNLIDGLLPQDKEIKLYYNKRKGELKAKMQSAWNEFDLGQ